MAVCPNCGESVPKPVRKIETHLFCVEAYTCPKCGYKFKNGC